MEAEAMAQGALKAAVEDESHIAFKRGRPALARTIRAPPPNVKTIIMVMGGRWFDLLPYGMHYRGGYKRYIHCVNPIGFKFVDLARAVIEIVGDGNLPTRFWFHMHGLEFPSGLTSIQSENDILRMWTNCADFTKKCAVLYTQDLEFEMSSDLESIEYSAPAVLPSVAATFNPAQLYALAIHRQLMADRVGPFEQWRKESDGEHWYVSTDQVARVLGV